MDYTAHQSPLSMRFSWKEHWSGLPFPPLEGLPNPGIKPASPAFPALAERAFTTELHGRPNIESSLSLIFNHYNSQLAISKHKL